MVDVIRENAREGLMKEVLHADNTVLMSESIKNLRKTFEMERGVETKELKVNLKKTKVIVCGSKEEIPKS